MIMKTFIKLSILIFSILTLSLFSCKEKDVPNEKPNPKITFSNIKIEVPEEIQLTYTPDKMSIAVLSASHIAPINIFNFGNKPILVQANIDRWKSQFDTVLNTSKEKLMNGMIHYVEIQGIKKDKKTNLIAGIIPTSEGPYYIKSESFEENVDKTRTATKKILHSIIYD